MSLEFIFRLIGMTIFAVIGARLGEGFADDMNLPSEANSLLFLLAGALTGLLITPWITTRPAATARRAIIQTRAETLVTSIFGLLVGLVLAALLALPLSMLPDPAGQYLPTIMAVVTAYLSIILFSLRGQDMFSMAGVAGRGNMFGRAFQSGEILLDTNVIIDGRILDLSQTGFVSQKLVVPQFVVRELQHIADSSDTLRRQRGRHGLDVLNKLRQESKVPVEVIDEMPAEGTTVDEKLVMLAAERSIPIMTNDFNLNKVAAVRGVAVLNINDLAMALRPVYLPGEVINLHIIQEGREEDQGVGYLIDGTMVVVEGGKRYRDRTIPARITRYILSSAGKMYFAQPEPQVSK